MNRNRQEEYRFHRAIALNITFLILIIIFYGVPKFDFNPNPLHIREELELIIEPPPPTDPPAPLSIPYPSIPVEAESDEPVDDEQIPSDSIVFAYMDIEKFVQASRHDTINLLDSLEFNFDEVDEKPALLHYVEPEYPSLARLSMITGKVVLKILVNRQGKVEKVKCIEGNSLFYDSAIKAGFSCRFKPAKRDGIPVKVWLHLPVIFRLK